MDKTIRVGLVGAGFLAEIRSRSYRLLGEHRAKIVGIASRTRARAEEYARRHGVPRVFDSYQELLEQPEIDVVDLCVPNSQHKPMVIAAAKAGKHVICTKPLTAYCGEPGEDLGNVPRQQMLQSVVADADEMVRAARENGVKLMYAENWVYAPSIQKARRLIEASQGTILEISGGESHSGSHSPYSKEWAHTGGGSLLRMGAHPIGAALYLKRVEGVSRNGSPIRPQSVVAEVGHLERIPSRRLEEKQWMVTGRVDVEDWGVVVVTFSDGSKAILRGTDILLGGMESSLEIFMSNARIQCQMSPTNLVRAYAPDPAVFGDEYIMEKVETKAGWGYPAPDEEWTLGQHQQVADFVEALTEARDPLSTGELGRDVVAVAYSGYVSAEEGRRIEVPQ
jgi:predicted dehydrogenase